MAEIRPEARVAAAAEEAGSSFTTLLPLNTTRARLCCGLSSEFVVVPGEVFTIVGGLAAHKHVPVVQDLLPGQQLILKVEMNIKSAAFHTGVKEKTVPDQSTLSWSDSYTRCLASAWAWS